LAQDDTLIENRLPGLNELLYEMGVCGVDEKTIGWKIAPAINALSRLGEPTDTALDLFDPENGSPEKTAAFLVECNRKRQELTESSIGDLLNPDSRFPKFEPKHCNLFVSDIPEGLIGLAAGRLSRSFNNPCFVGSIRGDTIKFSGRSPDDRVSLDMVMAVAKGRKLLISGGGHSQACGFSLLEENLEAFIEVLDAVMPKGSNVPEYPVIGEIEWLPRVSAWVDVIEGLRPFGGPDVVRPFIKASAMKIITHPSEMKRRSDGKVWALKFHLGELESGSLEVIVTDLDRAASLRRGQVLDCILQVEVSTTVSGNYVNWKLVDFQPTESPGK